MRRSPHAGGTAGRAVSREAVAALTVATSASAGAGQAALVGLPAIAGTARVTDSSQIGANKFKPAQCAGMTLTNLVVVTGGGGAGLNAHSNLIIGDGSHGQVLVGGSLSDCILADGASTADHNLLLGMGGDDVIVGGRWAKNTYAGNAGSDICYYRPNDAVPAPGGCEVSVLLP